jgi:hypothetical protein
MGRMGEGRCTWMEWIDGNGKGGEGILGFFVGEW